MTAGARYRIVRALIISTLSIFAGLTSTRPATGQTVSAPALPSGGPTFTQAADHGRTGWYPQHPQLSPADVASADFGLRWNTAVEGQIYAQPLAFAGTVVVATEANVVAGLDEGTGGVRWSRKLGTPIDSAALGCPDLLPTVGVTGTPVIDPDTGTAYVAVKAMVGGRHTLRVHAIDIGSGRDRKGWPVTVEGVASNDPSHRFDAKWANQRPGLILLGGVVYLATAAYCDLGRYEGWVVGIGTDASIRTLWSAYAGTAQSGAGIWQSGAGIASDGPATMVVTTGNGFGPSSSTLGDNVPSTLAQSVVRLRVQPDGSLRATDFFSPYDAARLDKIDGDLGASAPVVLPDSFGTAASPRLLFQSSKTGYSYLLNRDDLGGRGTGASGSDRVVSRVGPHGGQWGRAAVWPGDGGWIYVVTNTDEQTMNAYQVVADSNGRAQLVLRGRSAQRFGKLSGSAVVTSAGTASGSALVWVIHQNGPDGSGGELRAYSPVPQSGRLQLLWRGPIGTASKFSIPLPVGAQIIVGTRDGRVLAFGRPSALRARAVASATVPVLVGQRVTARVEVTSATDSAFTIDGVQGAGRPALEAGPASVPPGGTAAVSVSVDVAQRGESSVPIVLQTGIGPIAVNVPITGRDPGAVITVEPPVVSFGGVAIGGPSPSATVTVTNEGSQPAVIAGIAVTPGLFEVMGGPITERTLAPGEVLAVEVAMRPLKVGEATAVLTVRTAQGQGQGQAQGQAQGQVDVALTATVGGQGVLTTGPAVVDLGSVSLGRSVVVPVPFANSGGAPLTITRSKGPAGAGGFVVVADLPEGTVLLPGDVRTGLVRFTAKRRGTFTDRWTVNADAPGSARTLTFTVRVR